jgi:hypothetical protein
LVAITVGAALGLLSAINPMLGGVTVIGVVGLYLLLTRPMLLGYIVIAAIVLTSGMRRGALIPMLRPNEAALFALSGLMFFVVMLRRPKGIASQVLSVAALIWLFGTVIVPLVSYWFRGWRFSTSEITNLVGPIKFILVFWMFSYLPRSEKDRMNLLTFMIACAALYSIVGLLQVAKVSFVINFLGTYYPSQHFSDSIALGRVTSLFSAWNSTGTFLMIVIIIVIAIQPLPMTRFQRLIQLGSLALCAACLLASGSFAGIGGLLAGIGIVKFFDRRGLKFLLYLGLGLAIAALILSPIILARLAYQFAGSDGGTPQTFGTRLELWEKLFLPIIFANNPWFGIMPTLENVTWQWAESQYLYLLIRSGLVSLFAHLAWVGLSMFWLYRKWRQYTGLAQVLALVAFAVFFVMSIMSFTNEVFTMTGSVDYLWIMMALIVNSRGDRGESTTNPY